MEGTNELTISFYLELFFGVRKYIVSGMRFSPGWVLVVLVGFVFSFGQSASGIKAYNKVTISVPDVLQAEQWYQSRLGFHRLAYSDFVPSINARLLLMGIANTTVQIEFIQTLGPQSGGFFRPDPPYHYSTFGVSQFSFIVDKLESTIQQLIPFGVQVLWCLSNDLTGHRMFFIKDLNLNILQFIDDCPCTGPGCCPPIPEVCPKKF